MATKTTNYELVKIALTDAPPDITAINPNWDKIDGELHSLSNQLSSKAPAYTYGTTDLTAGTSALETGKLYFVYE